MFVAYDEALRGSRSHIPVFKGKGPPSTGLPGSAPLLRTTSCVCSTARVLRIVCCIARCSYRIPCIPRPSTSTVRSQMRLANFARSRPRSLKHQSVPSSVDAPPIEPPLAGAIDVHQPFQVWSRCVSSSSCCLRLLITGTKLCVFPQLFPSPPFNLLHYATLAVRSTQHRVTGV